MLIELINKSKTKKIKYINERFYVDKLSLFNEIIEVLDILDKNKKIPELIDLVMKHDIHHRTPLSENKYIDDCISKGYLHVLPSSKDHRKKVIIASDKMIKEMAEWLLEHSVTDT